MIEGTSPILATVAYSPTVEVTGYLSLVIFEEEPFIVLTDLEDKLVLLPLNPEKIRGTPGDRGSACDYPERLFAENAIIVDKTRS